jgi:branched-chain amino acid transport system substrate-binding protein
VKNGIQLAMQQVNDRGGVKGKPLDIFFEDEQSNDKTAIQKANLLTGQVPVIIGGITSNTALAIAPVCEEAGVPLVVTLSAGDDLTQRKRSKYITRVSFTGCEIGHVAGDYAYKKLGWRKVVTLGMDYAWGHECIGGFHRTFEEAGGKVIQKVWAPIATTDFGPYIASLKRDADGIYEVVTGAASIRFIKAMKSSGLMEKWKVMAPGSATDESLLPALGEDALGVFSVMSYSGALKTPGNAKFNEKIQKAYKKNATMSHALCYTGADWIVQTIKSINGDVENKEKFFQALRSLEMKDSLRGPLKMDKYGHIIQNMYVRRVDKEGNAYQNTVIETYPMVSQFFKFDPETYLKAPVYGRDYPPCKFCQ